MIEPSLTASRILLFDCAVLTSRMNQRPESLSYRTRGSVVMKPTRTELKKESMSASNCPTAPVLLLKTRIRPLTASKYCVGPAAPIASGGNALVSAKVAAVKVRLGDGVKEG